MFATFKLLFVYTALGPIAGLIGIPYSFLVSDISGLYRVAMWIAHAGVRAAGIRTEVVGVENVPVGKSCIFMCNHVSNLDPPVLLPVLPGRSSVLLKKELMRIPILGLAMRMGKFVPVERGQKREAAKASVAAAADALAFGTAYPGVSGGDSLAGWAIVYVQEGAVLSGAGDAGSDCADCDFGDGEDDAEGKRGDYAGSGASAVAAGD